MLLVATLASITVTADVFLVLVPQRHVQAHLVRFLALVIDSNL